MTVPNCSSKMPTGVGRNEDMTAPTDSPAHVEPVSRRPYCAPVLRVFGSVAAITATISMDGQQKDGGPNNIKT